jgi:RNA-directed DNA polymerase
MSNSEKPSLKLKASREELAEKFSNLNTIKDIASLLEIDHWLLIYYLYRIPDSSRYRIFQIKKRHSSTSTRTISAPNRSLKIIQSKLAQVLSSVYTPKASVEGFREGRSILSNASKHTAQKFVLNIDLSDFFPSINFGRVRGMFMATPYNLNEKVSTVLAQICCFNNELPQGAPTSPIVSNMICAKMDSKLRILAQFSRCYYTRYADDLTFSTSSPKFPAQLATIITGEKGNYLQLGDQLKTIIENNGFKINSDKVRLQTKTHRQEVTGLVTNEFPNVRRRYIRQVRAMLHAWEKYGPEKAEQEYFNKYRSQSRSPHKDETKYRRLSFRDILLGKIEFIGSIRGKDDFIFIKLLTKLISLSPDLIRQKERIAEGIAKSVSIEGIPDLFITTEGPTDWMHMKAAQQALTASGKYTGLRIKFHEYEHKMGDVNLSQKCETLSSIPVPGNTKYVFIFDRDNPSIIPKVNAGIRFKKWSDKVFSFSIPVPKHRKKTPEISIEFNYSDNEIKRIDKEGRRLFISHEFHGDSQIHKTENLFCKDQNKFKNNRICIIDNHVYSIENKTRNIALPKKKFAKYVLEREPNFDDFDFTNFCKIFDNLEKIKKS